MKNLKTLLNVRIGLGIVYFVIAMVLSSMINEEKAIAGPNTDIEADLSDTSTLDKYEVIRNLEKESGTGATGELSLNYDGLGVEEKPISAEEVVENERKISMREDVPRYERTKGSYDGNQIVNQYQKEKTLEYEGQNENTRVEPPKKRGFNTISYSGNNSSGQISSSSNQERYSCRIPYEQTVGLGNKVKVILKESIGDKREGEYAIGVVQIASNVGENRSVDVVFSGNQFGLSYPLFLYFGNSRGIETEGQKNNYIENEAKDEGSNIASSIVSEIPIVGSLGSRIIRTASSGSNRGNNIKIDLISGERLTLGQ